MGEKKEITYLCASVAARTISAAIHSGITDVLPPQSSRQSRINSTQDRSSEEGVRLLSIKFRCLVDAAYNAWA